jgi:hypothetical protein
LSLLLLCVQDPIVVEVHKKVLWKLLLLTVGFFIFSRMVILPVHLFFLFLGLFFDTTNLRYHITPRLALGLRVEGLPLG